MRRRRARAARARRRERRTSRASASSSASTSPASQEWTASWRPAPSATSELAAPDDLGGLASPVEARLEPPLELDRPLDALDAARELDPREQAAVLQRQRLRDADDAVAGAVGRLEDVRAPEIAARGLELAGGCEREAAAALGIEERARTSSAQCRLGSDMKSTEPSAATSATVLPSPIAAYEPIGAKPSYARAVSALPRSRVSASSASAAEVGLDLLERAVLRLRDERRRRRRPRRRRRTRRARTCPAS